MRNRVFLVFTIFSFFLIAFLIQKIVFLFVHTDLLNNFSFEILFTVLKYGFIYDLTMASYLSIIPIALIALSVWINRSIIAVLSNLYFFISITLITIIAACDILFYPTLGLRLSYDAFVNLAVYDDTFFANFLVQLILGGFVSLSIIFIFYLIYNYSIKRQIVVLKVPKLLSKTFFVVVLLGLTLAIPIKLVRSPQYATIEDHFNGDDALNQAVVNEPFYFITSYLHADLQYATSDPN